MRTIRSGVVATILAIGALTQVGCAENESTLFIKGVMKVDEGTCTYTPDASSVLLLGGVLDTAFGGSYTAALLVGNQMKSQGSEERSRTETSRITLKGAVVALKDSTGALIEPEFSADGVGFVDPSPGGDAAFGMVSVLAVPDAGRLAAENIRYVMAEMQVYGETLGGQEVESNVYSFPISLCNGCLVSFPSEAISPTTGECQPAPTASDNNVCLVGQDQVVLCSDCVAQYPDACLAP